MKPWKPLLMLPFAFAFNAGARVAGSIFRVRYARFLVLPSVAKRAAERGALVRATALGQELLDLADAYRGDWNYGNAVHQGHLVLGRVALARGDVDKAKAELLAAGGPPGSPQLDSFGPSMRLAKDLLDAGEIQGVLEYLELCRAFWKMDRGLLDQWKADVLEGRTPKFGPHLRY